MDDFVITATFEEDFVERLERLCASIAGPKDLRDANLAKFFERPARGTVLLEHNAAKALRLRRKCAEYFAR